MSIVLLFSFLFNHVSAKTESQNVINALIPQIRAKIKQYPSLSCGIYIKANHLKNKSNSININGNASFPAASLIKIPIAVVLLREIDKGKFSWNRILILKPYHYAQGAGYLRTRKVGTKISLKEAFRLMLSISDNTATNMIIDLLGGSTILNNHILALGLQSTKINNFLGDFRGTNKTSPYDLANILEKSLEGALLSNNSKRLLKNTLLKVQNKSLIKKGLGRYTKFAHKTGTIGICVGDAGIIYLPFGKKIVVSIIVKRPFNSLQGQKLIREVSQLLYKNLT